MTKRNTKGPYFKPPWNYIVPKEIASLIEFCVKTITEALIESSHMVLSDKTLRDLAKAGYPTAFSYYAKLSSKQILSRYLKPLKKLPKYSLRIKDLEANKKLKENLSLDDIKPNYLNKQVRLTWEFYLEGKALAYSFICLANNFMPIGIIAKMANNGDDESLFLLVQIDKAIINENWVRRRIYRAQMRGEKLFFYNLARALQKDELSGRRKDLRAYIALALLDESNLLGKLSYRQIADFLCDKGIADKSEAATKMLVRGYYKAKNVN